MTPRQASDPPPATEVDVTVEHRRGATIMRLVGRLGDDSYGWIVDEIDALVSDDATGEIVVATDRLSFIAPQAARAILAACERHSPRVISTEVTHLLRCATSDQPPTGCA